MTIDWQHPDAALRVAVFGSGGGIGTALVRRLAEQPAVDSVLAYSSGTSEAAPHPRIRHCTVDILSDESLAKAAAEVPQGLRIVIIATGTLHGDRYQPERRLREIDANAMLEVYRVNTIAPTLIAKHFLPLLDRDRHTIFAALSARVGSISDNRLGGWASYRASKAALNMVLKTLSIEHARIRPRSVVLGLHPGTVDTGLSKPFSGNVPEDKLFTPNQAADYLLDVMVKRTPEDSGGVFGWDGQRIDC